MRAIVLANVLFWSLTIYYVPTVGAQPFGTVDAYPNLTFDWPVEVRQAPGDTDHVFVVEWSGKIRVFRDNPSTMTAETFLDVSGRAIEPQGEAGLLGLAFDPDYSDNGTFYVSYIGNEDPLRLIVSRFRTSSDDPLRGDPDSESILLQVEQVNNAHNGGQLQFGPDGYLYVALGDGGVGKDPGSHGQDPTTMPGSILRIDPDDPCCSLPYGIPPNNPFVGSENGEREEIFAYGFRNPWRFSFDRQNGDMWVGDVGEQSWEEINRIELGGNYGWNAMEGPYCFEAEYCDSAELRLPVWAYGRDEGVAVIGGYVYRGDDFPGLQGSYIFADYDAGRLDRSETDSYKQRVWGLRIEGPDSSTVALLAEPSLIRVLTLGEMNSGELLIAGLVNSDDSALEGRLLRLIPRVSESNERVPTVTASLQDSYPNPFATSTRIEYSLDAASSVDLSIFDARGRRIRTLVSAFQRRGQHHVSWDGLDGAGSEVATGTYFVRLELDGRSARTLAVTRIS